MHTQQSKDLQLYPILLCHLLFPEILIRCSTQNIVIIILFYKNSTKQLKHFITEDPLSKAIASIKEETNHHKKSRTKKKNPKQSLEINSSNVHVIKEKYKHFLLLNISKKNILFFKYT